MNKEAKILIGIAVGTIALLVGGSLLFNKVNNTTTPPKVYDSSLVEGKNDAYSKGPDNASVTITEFGDLECPACGQSEPVIEQVISQYKDKVKFVFRQFPLSMHPDAVYAAEAAEAA